MLCFIKKDHLSYEGDLSTPIKHVGEAHLEYASTCDRACYLVRTEFIDMIAAVETGAKGYRGWSRGHRRVPLFAAHRFTVGA